MLLYYVLLSSHSGKMQGAEKRYLVIEGDVLNLYTTDRTTDRPIDWFMLNEKTTVCMCAKNMHIFEHIKIY